MSFIVHHLSPAAIVAHIRAIYALHYVDAHSIFTAAVLPLLMRACLRAFCVANAMLTIRNGCRSGVAAIFFIFFIVCARLRLPRCDKMIPASHTPICCQAEHVFRCMRSAAVRACAANVTPRAITTNRCLYRIIAAPPPPAAVTPTITISPESCFDKRRYFNRGRGARRARARRVR